MLGQSFAISVGWFVYVWHLNLLSSFSLHLVQPHLLCNQHQLIWHRMELIPTPSLQTTEGNLMFIATFSVLSLLIIIFVLLIFNLNHFDSNATFQVSSFPFRPSNVSITNAKWSKYSSSSKRFLSSSSYLMSFGSASNTMIYNKGLITESWCNPVWTWKLSLKVRPTLTRFEHSYTLTVQY